MKKNITILLCLVASLIFSSRSEAKNYSSPASQGLYFIENKGQVKDQYGNSRNDVQYVLQSPGLTVFIGNGQLHYQFSKKIPGCGLLDINPQAMPYPSGTSNGKGTRQQDIAETILNGSSEIETYRMDVELAGANKQPEMITEQPLAYHENYFFPGCPANGIRAYSYNRITYKNVYPGIDWVVFIKDNKLEHEFVIGSGADASQIKLKYNGQTSLKINEDGSITATTPMGTIREHAPVCYRADGRIAPSSFNLQNNLLSYDVNVSGLLVIDPVLEWGTYYGPDSSSCQFYDITCDNSGHVYGCGLTWGAPLGVIATIGSFQDTLRAGTDAFLVKFDSSGNRIWATYYGGEEEDWGIGVACDQAGHIYMAGTTSSLTGISTPGSQQPAYGGGGFDGFIVKFDSSGNRFWGTYLGGSGTNYNGGICCDTQGHIYVGGIANDHNNVATPASYQPSPAGGYDDYLVQYDTAGARQWGTYYGGPGAEFGGMVCSDGVYVYLTGYTASTTGIATAGSQQPSSGGGNDAFLAKFNALGSRQWGTYYGGANDETMGGLTCDIYGNVYLFGITGSDSGISTPGSFQPAIGGLNDGFLVKFDVETGKRDWATYYGGGPGDEYATSSRIASDNSGNVYITGYTNSTGGIAPAGSWQSTYGGGTYDAFLAEFSNSGSEVWSTYFGGDGDDQALACAFDGKCVYICGLTNSDNQIATPGAFLTTCDTAPDYNKCFLAKFYSPPNIDSALSTIQKQLAAASVNIYPNPNTGTFILNASLPNITGDARIIITDQLGRIIMTDEATINNGTINKIYHLGNEVSTGAYFIKVICPDNVFTLKFVKE